MKMDRRDLQLLELMARNCRLSHSTLAQALHLSKDAVAYRLRKLEREGYLAQYVLFVDARKLGFTRYHLLLKFDAGIQDKQKMYQAIAEHEMVMWVNTFIGRYDIQVIVDARDGFHLNQIKEELFAMCDHKVKEYSVLMHLSDLEFTQLDPVIDLGTPFQKKHDYSFSASLSPRNFPVDGSFERYRPTKVEIELLKLLADDPRASLVALSEQTGVDRATVKKRIASLITNGIILSFGGIPARAKQGFVTYYLLVRLEQETPLAIMKRPFARLQNIFYAGRMIGDYDMILYLNARNPEELNSSIELFKADMEAYIQHYELLVQDKVHHWRQFTDGIYRELLKK